MSLASALLRSCSTAATATGSAAASSLLRAASLSMARNASFWAHVPEGPLDGNKATTAAYKADPSPNKVNLGEGIYKDDNGDFQVLNSVKQAEARVIAANLDHAYAPITGVPEFVSAAQKLAFGADSELLSSDRLFTAQSLSGTGALRVGGEFLAKWLPEGTHFYVTAPTWVNHFPLFKSAGFPDVKTLRYFDVENSRLDLPNLLEDLRAAPEQSVMLFHACAHNPTGCDPTAEEWAQIEEVVAERNHVVFFDTAYQGFASGDPVKDRAAIQYFVDKGHQVLVAQSFAKSFGLYGQRVGALNIVCGDAEEKKRVDSQVKILIRSNYSCPPLHGARIVSEVLHDDALTQVWYDDIKMMSSRIIAMRETLVDALKGAGSTRDWSHITSQIGMFSYTGLTEENVMELRAKHSVYMNKDGRMSMSGVNTKNVEYLANAMKAVTEN